LSTLYNSVASHNGINRFCTHHFSFLEICLCCEQSGLPRTSSTVWKCRSVYLFINCVHVDRTV